MENLQIDENGRNVLGAITNDAFELIKNLRVNPVTGRLLVDANVSSTNTSIGSTIPGGTAGSVLFLGVGSTLAEDNANFFYDDTSNFLGLGTNTPDATLHVVGTFHYADGTEQNGYVLTSDANGNASWQPGSGGGGSGYNLIQNNGVSVTQRTTINLSTLLTATDSGGKTALTINVTNLANDNTFVTTLANNTTFITELTDNSTFQSNIITVINNDPSLSVDLTSQVTGVLPVGNGGSGANTLTGLLQGNGTSPFTTVTNSTTVGQVLRVTGANTYAWGAVNLADTDAITGDLPFSNLTQGTARSVLGVTGNATADFASIQGTANQVLVINSAGTALSFGQVNIASSAAVTGVLALANGGLGSALSDPNADKVIGWDDTDGTNGYWTLGSGLTYTHATHTLSAVASTKISISTASTTVGSGSTTTVYTVAIAGGTLGTNNGIKFTIALSAITVDSSNTVTVNVIYGGSTISAVTLNGQGDALGTTDGILTGMIVGNGATNAQKGVASIVTTFNQGGTPIDATAINTDYDSAAVDSTVSQNLEIQIVNSGGSSSATAQFAVVERIA